MIPPQSNELWQAYDEQGRPSGALSLDQARAGALHGAVHVWVWHRNGDDVRVLLQVRSVQMLTWPGYLDTSAGGHIDAGEEPLAAAIRETNEELGEHIKAEQLHLLFVHRMRATAPPHSITENELQWVYGVQLEPDEHLRLSKREVDAARWVEFGEFQHLALQDDAQPQLVPHGPVYFAELFRAIDLLKQP